MQHCSTASSYALQSAYKYLVLVIHDADTDRDWHSPCRGFQLATSNWLLWLFMKHVEIKSSTTIKIVKITQSLDFIGWNNIYLSVIYSTSLCLIVSRFGRNSGRLNLMNWLCHQLRIRIEMFLFWTRKYNGGKRKTPKLTNQSSVSFIFQFWFVRDP